MRIFWILAIVCLLCPLSADAYVRKNGGSIDECSRYREGSSIYWKCMRAYDREYYNYNYNNNYNNRNNMNYSRANFMPSKGTYGSNLNARMSEDKNRQQNNTKVYLNTQPASGNYSVPQKEGVYLRPR